MQYPSKVAAFGGYFSFKKLHILILLKQAIFLTL